MPYSVTLWRALPWYRGGDTAVLDGEQAWLDLADEAQVTEAVAELIVRSGGREDNIGQYRAVVCDLATGDVVTRVSRSVADLDAVRSGARAAPPAPGLDGLSNEVLIRELARRLTGR